MSHPANDPYNEAGINILKHGEGESHAMLKKHNESREKVAKHMRKHETKASKVFPKEFRRYSPQDRLKHELAKKHK
jgi:hypothetical protein